MDLYSAFRSKDTEVLELCFTTHIRERRSVRAMLTAHTAHKTQDVMKQFCSGSYNHL